VHLRQVSSQMTKRYSEPKGQR